MTKTIFILILSLAVINSLTGCQAPRKTKTGKKAENIKASYPPEPPLPSWEGVVGFLGEESPYKDYFQTVFDDKTFGIRGATPEIEQRIVRLRDTSTLKIWGRLKAPAKDFSNKQIIVQEIRTNYKIEEEDSNEISRLQRRVLEYALLNKPLDKRVTEPFPDFSLKHHKSNLVILENINLSEKIELKLPKKELLILNGNQMQNKADFYGDYQAFSFGAVVSRKNWVSITLSLNWVTAKASRDRYLSGGAIRTIFKRINGDWVLVRFNSNIG